MAQAGYTPIRLYYSTTASNVPSAGNLADGELALNIANTDMSVYLKNASGTVKKLFSNPASLVYPTTDGTNNQVLKTDGSGNLSWTTVVSTPGGSTTQVQYNNAGSFAGSANFTFNGTTATINTLNLTNALGVAYGGTGATTLAANNVILGNGTSAVQTVAPSTNGNVLTSNGTTWVSQAPAASGVSQAKATAIAMVFGF